MRTLILFLVLLFVPACPKNGPGPVIGSAAIDCLGQNRPRIDSLLGEFTPLFTGGKIDWSAVYTRGKQAGRDIGTCFVLELTNLYLSGTKSPEDAQTAYQTAQRFRDEIGGGATVKTKCKADDGSMRDCKL
jgi:hypothetical protein